MAFDWANVEGYDENMTPEDKLKLLENYEAPKQSYEGYVKKDQFDKTASELAAAKKELKAKLSEDEQKEQERLEESERMKAELESLRKEKTVSLHKSSFLSLGYGEELASKAAVALESGDTDSVFKYIGEQNKILEAKYKADSLDKTPKPGAGEPEGKAVSEFEKKLSRAMRI